MPVTHVNASYVRSHFDAMEVGVSDAPRADEIVLALVMTTGPRIHARVGGLAASADQGRGRIAMKARIRKLVTILEEVRTEMGRPVDPPTRRAAAVAVIANPFAGRFVEDLADLVDIGEELGRSWPRRRSRRSVSRGPAPRATARPPPWAKTASWSTPRRSSIPSSAPRVRKVLGKGAALIPSSKKRGGPGVSIDIPLGHKDAAFVRSHFDGMEVRINDAPRADEIMVAVAVTASGRPLPRVGGLTVADVKGEDGLR